MNKIIRSVLFLPILFIGTTLLQALPVFVFEVGKNLGWWNIKLSFWGIFWGVGFIIPICIALLFLWANLVLKFPVWVCTKIATNNKVASVIFGTLFVLFEILTILTMASRGYHFWAFAYQIFFSILLILSVTTAYQTEF